MAVGEETNELVQCQQHVSPPAYTVAPSASRADRGELLFDVNQTVHSAQVLAVRALALGSGVDSSTDITGLFAADFRVCGQLSFLSQLGHDPDRVVHASQTISLLGDVPLDQRLRFQTRVVGTQQNSSGTTFVTKRSVVRDGAGNQVAELESRFAVLPPGGPTNQAGSRRTAVPAVARLVGRRTYTETLIQDFGNVTGDRSSIHMDPVSAQRLGMRSTIAHGMLLMADMAAAVGTLEVPGGLRSMSSVFRKPVVAGDRISFYVGSSQIDAGEVSVLALNASQECVATSSAHHWRKS